ARRYPWTGIGHGPHVFWHVYTKEYQAGLGDPELKEHPYNSYLELLAGSGVVALLAFLTVLGVAAGRLLVVRRTVAEAPAALGLLTAMAVFAGTNTILQGALGGVVWLVVLACGVLGAVSRPSRADGA
ncbi:MAG: O-antigen ligase family protein, partial [Candidatus Sumerlaeia bacterium]|nr:O-antigen ligase family protein [Candidatus Sumerlaeia bacterium]